ncbi:MAG: protein phosphatase 2C domain-containing protein [Bacteroidales bacterium]|nr:protein phosphatase 2C domain-containing protein [Bacteroidales bacterium]
MKNYDIAFKSEKGSKKDSYERNGDHCAFLETGSCVVAALADGVGSCINDAEASETACELFIEKCRTHLERQMIDEETMRRFCEEIDPILAEKGEKSCFSAVVWRPAEDHALWLNAGDTRIYRYGWGSGFEQITVDDHGESFIPKVNGKVRTDHGAVATIITPINSAIGDRKHLFHTGQIDFLPGRSLVLCSDGMYNATNFAEHVETALGGGDLVAATGRIPHTDGDDASILILRRTDGYEQTSTIQSLTAEINAEAKNMPRHILLREIASVLSQGIAQEGEEESLTEFIKTCGSRRLFLAHETAIGILEAAKKRYYSLPADSQHKKGVERMVITLQNYVADGKRFGG